MGRVHAALTAALLVLLLHVDSAACSTSLATALTVRVGARDGVCFYEQSKMQGERGYLHFQVTSGGRLEIDVEVKDPKGEYVYSGEMQKEEKIMFNTAMAGTYSFCFSNTMSTMSDKTVAFDIAIGDPLDDDESRPRDPIEKSIIRLTEGLREVKMEQQYLATRERGHRKTAESTDSRVFWFSVLEGLLLMAVGGGQIYYLRRQFETKRYV